MTRDHYRGWNMLVGILVGLSLFPLLGHAEILVPVQDQTLVDVTVESSVVFDPSTQLYTYSYQVTSLPTSQLNVGNFAITFDGEIMNVLSPQGWDTFPSRHEPFLMWAAIEVPEGMVPPDWEGASFPSPFQIQPGQTLGGFSIQSPEPGQTVKFYAQGWAQVPTATDEEDFHAAGITFPVFPENWIEGSTVGPGLDDSLIFAGGRRHSVDGFLGFVGAENRETRALPVTIIVRFGNNGENVDTTTFTARLNRVDMTQEFQLTGNGSEKMAVFALGSSPIVVGRNVLRTSVDGIVPDTTRTAADSDALTFFAVE